MSELIPKCKDKDGGGWETPWYCDTRPNWLIKVVHDDDKNETEIRIIHFTPTHVAVPKYIGDEKWGMVEESKSYYPVFQCPVCKRKSKGFNFITLWDMIGGYYMNKALDENAKVIIAPDINLYNIRDEMKKEEEIFRKRLEEKRKRYGLKSWIPKRKRR